MVCPGESTAEVLIKFQMMIYFESLLDGYFKEYVGPYEKLFAGKSICRQCHPRCTKCTGYGFHENVCSECARYRRGEQCEDECGENQYADESSKTCEMCDEECQKCRGPGPHNCLDCKNLRIFHEGVLPEHYDNTTEFNCSLTCPFELRYKIFPSDGSDTKTRPYCSAELPESMSMHGGVSYLIVIAFIFVGLAMVLLFIWTCELMLKSLKTNFI